MVIYKCPECSFKTANKIFYEAHLRRSKHVPPVHTEPKPEIVPEPIPEPVPEIIEKKPKRRPSAEIIFETKSIESEELENE